MVISKEFIPGLNLKNNFSLSSLLCLQQQQQAATEEEAEEVNMVARIS